MATPITIADAAVAVGADLKQYDADLQKAQASGTSASAKLAAAFKSDFGKAVAAGAAGVAAIGAIVLKGANDEANAMAKFRADTGLVGQDAKDAQTSLTALYKTNVDGFDAIAGAMAVVHNNLGLVGQDLQDTTQLALTLGHVTDEGPVSASQRLVDVTKAYNLTAQEQVDLLDKLTVSHETYGTSIDDGLDTLIKLSPALHAANLSYDDGIGLLNLFSKAGLDAAGATRAFNTALTKIKSPADLQTFLTQIAQTPDPLQAAQEAAALFGARAGPQLAAALRQSNGELSAFTPNAQAAAGALDASAQQIESTFGDKLKVLFHSLTGDLDNFASNASNIVGALQGLPAAAKLATTALGVLVLANKEATAAEVAQALATKAQALAFLLLHPEFLLTAIQLGVLSLAEGAYAIATGVATVATTALGIAIDILLGPIGLVVLALTALFLAYQSNFFGIRDIVNTVVTFVGDHLSGLLPILKAVGDALGAVLGFAGQVLGAIGQVLTAAGNAVGAASDAVRGMGTKAIGHLVKETRAAKDDVYQAAYDTAKAIPDAIDAAQRSHDASVAAAADRAMEAGAQAIAARKIDWAEQASGAAKSIGQALVDEGPTVLRNAANLALGMAQGLRDKRSAIDQAMSQLTDDIKNRMNATKEIGHDVGLAVGKKLSDALHSTDPVVKNQAQGTRDLIEAELIQLIQAGGKVGKDTMTQLTKDMHSKDPDVRAQAKRTKSLLDNAMKEKSAPKTPGDAIGDQLNADLQNKGTDLGKTAYSIGRTIYSNLVAGVKGTGTVGYSPPAGSRQIAPGVSAYAMGTSYVPYDQLAFIHQGEAVLTPNEASVYRAAGLGGSSGPLVNIEHIDASGHADPAAAAAEVARQVGDIVTRALRNDSRRHYMGSRP